MRHENLRKCFEIYLLHWSISFDSCQSVLDVMGNTCMLSVWANLKVATTSTEDEISNFLVYENLNRGLLDFDIV
jgi:hypothetical protein